MAIGLAAIGIYGVVNEIVVQRTAELAIRASLGASTDRMLWFVLPQGLWPVVAGSSCALISLPLVMQGIHGLLFKVARRTIR